MRSIRSQFLSVTLLATLSGSLSNCSKTDDGEEDEGTAAGASEIQNPGVVMLTLDTALDSALKKPASGLRLAVSNFDPATDCRESGVPAATLESSTDYESIFGNANLCECPMVPTPSVGG